MIKRRKILHIEDDAIVRDLVKTILERANYDVISVDDTIKGIEVAGSEIPNLIIMDLNMPGLNGYEATTRLKSIDKIRDVPIIALTGEDTHDESIIAGCDGYLKKPINVRTFPQQISEFLTRKKVTLRHPELESDYLKEYSSKLVARMQEKVEELQNTNRRLDDYTRTLEEYNKKLFKLNEVSNKLQTFISGNELLKFLPREICSELEFDRCFIFLVDRRELKLKLRYFYGDPELKEQKNFSIVESDLLLKRLLIYQELFWVNEELLQSMSEYRESPFTKIGFGEFFISPLAKNVIYEVNPMKPKEKTPLSILEEIRNEKFPVRHLLYVDNIPESNSPFSENDVRILRELVQTTALTYDNIELVRNLEQLYHQAERFAITDGLTGLFDSGILST